MDTSQNNLNPKKMMLMSKHPSNIDIQQLYLNNDLLTNKELTNQLFQVVATNAISRIKKNKKIYLTKDLTQIIFLELWIAIKTFDPYKNFDFYRWSSWHVKTALRNFFRSEKRNHAINLLEQNTKLNSIDIEYKIDLHRIINKKRIKAERGIKILYDYTIEEKTLTEISKEQRLSIEGVRKSLYKTLSNIQGDSQYAEGS